MTYHEFIVRIPAFIVLIVISGPFSAWADVPALMGKLSADDPTSRDRAGRELLEAGPSARPALVAALRSADPELRLRAGRLLLRMPWTHPDDPPAVRDVLAQYGKPQPEERLQKVAVLASLPDQAGVPALLRLLGEDPSDSVRWAICGKLRLIQSSRVWNRLRQMEPVDRSGPELASMGWAWAHYDPRQSVQLMRQAIEEDVGRPEQSSGEITLVLRYAIEQERLGGQFGEAIQLLRRGIIRSGGYQRSQWAFELLALQVQQGPLEGFEQDRAVCQSILSPAMGLYVAGKLDQQQGDQTAAKQKYQQALETSQTPVEHLQAGDMLLDQRWDDLAERELNRVLEQHGGVEGNVMANAHFRLAQLAERRGDDFQTAEHLRQGLEAAGQTPGTVLTGPGAQGIWAQVYWRYYRAATERGDNTATEKNLSKLLALDDDDGEIAMDLTPRLSALGRKDEAMRIFDSAYRPARVLLDADQETPELLNNLAWLCARGGQNLTEALECARRATALAPHHPAFLDTQAEAEYRNGNRETAITLEKRALELRPGDPFMQKQLRRFEAGQP